MPAIVGVSMEDTDRTKQIQGIKWHPRHWKNRNKDVLTIQKNKSMQSIFTHLNSAELCVIGHCQKCVMSTLSLGWLKCSGCDHSNNIINTWCPCERSSSFVNVSIMQESTFSSRSLPLASSANRQLLRSTTTYQINSHKSTALVLLHNHYKQGNPWYPQWPRDLLKDQVSPKNNWNLHNWSQIWSLWLLGRNPSRTWTTRSHQAWNPRS